MLVFWVRCQQFIGAVECQANLPQLIVADLRLIGAVVPAERCERVEGFSNPCCPEKLNYLSHFAKHKAASIAIVLAIVSASSAVFRETADVGQPQSFGNS